MSPPNFVLRSRSYYQYLRLKEEQLDQQENKEVGSRVVSMEQPEIQTDDICDSEENY